MRRMLPGPFLLILPHKQVEVVYDSYGNPIHASQNYNIPCGCSSVFIALPLVLLVKWLCPTVIPFDLFAFWNLHGNPSQLVGDIWPFLVGTVLTALYWMFSPTLEENRWDFSYYWSQTGDFFKRTLWYYSFYALYEELAFRWLIFYSYIVGVTVLNYLLLGFAGHNLVQWLFTQALIPAADFVTFYKLHDILISNQYSWVVGAAILSANGKFRDGHSYQGWMGWIWSWYSGMFFFLIMFRYGLLVAVLVHIAHNLFKSWTAYLRVQFD
ncbi:CPBP family glutamic-type intramembrane protease [Ktedonospora formicarum]|uniref:Uncharacterized protein n=1 Tax=Ktedonospora formicarum TaxID=2778364 RepID=A0A8J3I6C1_9CHLR|nr:CPBP family glutamic-type intramembrane protease [Ktedonospora formicarum]GHO46189.1 hypothetical protein KSX_43520 [Ktedonospora formicarum]